jgi:hypothetical protein
MRARDGVVVRARGLVAVILLGVAVLLPAPPVVVHHRHRRAAERARSLHGRPAVEAAAVERVAARRDHGRGGAHHVLRVADGALPGGRAVRHLPAPALVLVRGDAPGRAGLHGDRHRPEEGVGGAAGGQADEVVHAGRALRRQPRGRHHLRHPPELAEEDEVAAVALEAAGQLGRRRQALDEVDRDPRHAVLARAAVDDGVEAERHAGARQRDVRDALGVAAVGDVDVGVARRHGVSRCYARATRSRWSSTGYKQGGPRYIDRPGCPGSVGDSDPGSWSDEKSSPRCCCQPTHTPLCPWRVDSVRARGSRPAWRLEGITSQPATIANSRRTQR